MSSLGPHSHIFQITKELPLPELDSTLIEIVHEPTGARILHIANEDPENLFCLSLQTLPSSSNGVAHILEHTVLCGSNKFPIKDPFFSMTRRSLNTYMNALTGQDFTCYPASSQIEKDFYNLLEVYLDAVFHPELKHLSFLQEGHRIEFLEPQNAKSPLQFQGVVFNEMKGALSSPEARLWKALFKVLMPDLPYAFDSGGDPKNIPELTYEELKNFHETFYHPSRCLFFFYGNIPLSKHLDFLSKHALEGVQKLAPLAPLPLQKRFSHPQSHTAFYPIEEASPSEKQTWIVFSWLTVPLIHQEEVLALSLLDSLLLDTDASPLKLALLKSGLCTSVDSSLDLEISEIPFSIVCKGSEKKHLETLKTLLFNTLRTCQFTKEQIEASLHQLEFDRTEIGAEGVPFGLSLFFRAGLIKQHGSEPENGLLIHSLFRDLRSHLQDPEFLPLIIRKYLLDNPHFVDLTFSPDPNLAEKERDEEKELLQKLRKGVNDEKLIQQSKDLANYQEEVETQSLDCLPKLTLHDIPKESRDFSLQKTNIDSLHVLHHNCFTNHILYTDLVYDLPHVPAEDLPLVSLYSRFMTELGSGKRNYAETLEYQQAYTGGISASLALHISKQNSDHYNPAFTLRGKALSRNHRKLLDLFAETAQGVDCKDTSRIQELLFQHATELQNRIVKSSMSYAIQTALSGFSSASFIYDQWHGFTYYQSVLKWAKNPQKLVGELSRIQETILAKGTPHLVLSCDSQEFDTLKKNHFFELSQKLPHHSHLGWKDLYTLPEPKSQVHFITSPVAFTARGMRTVAYKDPRAPFLLLATELLDSCHLHKAIREKGGAYGSGASYAPHTGNFHLYSFRDPNLAKTLDEFQIALEKIGSGKFTKQELEEAKFGIIQSIDTPVPPGNRAMTAYAWERSGRTLQERQAFREALLSATKQQVAHAVEELLIPSASTIVSFLGEDLFNKEKDKLKVSLL